MTFQWVGLRGGKAFPDMDRAVQNDIKQRRPKLVYSQTGRFFALL
jgi:hypothetical protein